MNFDLSEFNKEKMICVDSILEDKIYAHKFKYFGKADAIVNIYVPNFVKEIYLNINNNIEKINYLVNSQIFIDRKIVVSNCLPISLHNNKKFSILIRTHEKSILPPDVSIDCEYLSNSTPNSNNVSPISSYKKSEPINIISSPKQSSLSHSQSSTISDFIGLIIKNK